MRFSILPVAVCIWIAFLPTSFCENAVKGEILALQMPIPSRWMVLKTLARELNELGFKTTVDIPADNDVEKSMTDSGIGVIVSEGITQFSSIFKNMSTEAVKQGFSGKTAFIRSIQSFDKFYSYLVQDLPLMDTLWKRKFNAAIIDTIWVNLCASVIPY